MTGYSLRNLSIVAWELRAAIAGLVPFRGRIVRAADGAAFSWMVSFFHWSPAAGHHHVVVAAGAPTTAR
jgi:hypothetical protein